MTSLAICASQENGYPKSKPLDGHLYNLEGESIYRPDKRNVKRGDIPLSADVEDNAVFYLASNIVKGENPFGHPNLTNVKNYDVKCPYCKEKAITVTGSFLQFLNMYHSPHSASNPWTVLVSLFAACLLFCNSNYSSQSMHTRLILKSWIGFITRKVSRILLNISKIMATSKQKISRTAMMNSALSNVILHT